MPVPHPLASFPLVAASILAAGQARGQDIQWGNSNGGSFHTGSNWIGGVVPGASNTVYFGRTRDPDQQLVYTVTFTSSPSNVELEVASDRVTLDLNGNVYSLTDPIFAIRLGTTANGSGRLTITDGIVATPPDSQVTVGSSSNAPGFLTLSTGAQLFGAYTRVGNQGPGTFRVQNGADLVGGRLDVGSGISAGIAGSATVTGVGSNMVIEQLRVGGIGPGTVNVNGGGRIESTVGRIGNHANATGTVNVDGAGSRWTTSSDVLAGSGGQGTLNITGGGRVECDRVYSGAQDDSQGSINVSGAGVLVAQDRCDIGYQGPGILNVSTGGLVQSASGYVGNLAPATATVDGVGSSWVCLSELSVGAGGGTSVLSLTGGGTAHCTNGFLGRFAGGTGTVNVSGANSRWFVIQDLSIGGNAATSQPGGTGLLTIGPGGSVAANGIFLFPRASLVLNGGTLQVGRVNLASQPGGRFDFLAGLLVADRIEFNLTNQGGTLAPGPGADITEIFGHYTQQTGTMEIEIGGTIPDLQVDQVLVSGIASLGGTLDVRLINGFVPGPNQVFVALDAGEITGTFANVAPGQRLPVPGGGSFVVNYGPESLFGPGLVVLSDFSACGADFNGDGFLDFFDYLDYVTCFESGVCPPGKSADFNGDAFADFFDYADYVQAFETGC